MQTRGSPSGERPRRSPVKTRAVTNGKAPMHTSRRRDPKYTSYQGEEGPIHLTTVPEDRPLKAPPAWWEGVLIWSVTVAFVVYLTCGASNARLFGEPLIPVTIPTPPTSVPFTLIGFLRKAFTSSDY